MCRYVKLKSKGVISGLEFYFFGLKCVFVVDDEVFEKANGLVETNGCSLKHTQTFDGWKVENSIFIACEVWVASTVKLWVVESILLGVNIRHEIVYLICQEVMKRSLVYCIQPLVGGHPKEPLIIGCQGEYILIEEAVFLSVDGGELLVVIAVQSSTTRTDPQSSP